MKSLKEFINESLVNESNDVLKDMDKVMKFYSNKSKTKNFLKSQNHDDLSKNDINDIISCWDSFMAMVEYCSTPENEDDCLVFIRSIDDMKDWRIEYEDNMKENCDSHIDEDIINIAYDLLPNLWKEATKKSW